MNSVLKVMILAALGAALAGCSNSGGSTQLVEGNVPVLKADPAALEADKAASSNGNAPRLVPGAPPRAVAPPAP